ncbi:MAG TPA: response regulator, partial [Povalibacter sp.]|nr:response regulator [Povalibacter sp.]
MRILIVEDEAALRQSLVASFTAAGFTVDEAADGEEGLFSALEYPLDAAVVDLGLPKLPGLDLIRQLRAKQKTLPVLVLTTHISGKCTVEVLEAGADDYIHKPFQFEELLARLQT